MFFCFNFVFQEVFLRAYCSSERNKFYECLLLSHINYYVFGFFAFVEKTSIILATYKLWGRTNCYILNLLGTIYIAGVLRIYWRPHCPGFRNTKEETFNFTTFSHIVEKPVWNVYLSLSYFGKQLKRFFSLFIAREVTPAK